MTHLYRMSGLSVASEIALPGAWSLQETLASGPPDVVMRQGLVPMALAAPQVATRHWEAEGESILLRTDVGRFLITGGCEVVFEPLAGRVAEACALSLQGAAISMLLHQRGGVVLHASAVEIGGRSMLFCAASGEGKSTLAAALSLRGHAVLSDDICLVTFDAEGVPTVSADARHLKLLGSAIDAMHLHPQLRGAVLGNTDKTYVQAPVRGGGRDLPLGALYILESIGGDQGTCVIEPLDNAAALQQLRRNAHRPGLVRKTGQTQRYFEAAARIIAHAGVFALRRRRDLSELAQTVAALESHWHDLGLAVQQGQERLVQFRHHTLEHAE